MQELATGYGLIEGPVWDPAHGLYFSDVLGGDIQMDRKDKVSLAVRSVCGIGGMAHEEMKPANLHVIDLDGKARKISDGIMLRPRLFAR